MDAILNINKPPGMTSFAVVSRVRRLLKIKKAGHAGTLDPMAVGVLLVVTGRATRLSQFLMGRPKEYLATIKLGIETDTCDLEGQVIRQCDVPDIARPQLLLALNEFTGDIWQTPPSFSAIKIDGQPAYKKARQGKAVKIPERQVRVDAIDLIGVAGDEITIKVRCSKGTYVRSLARDIGQRLGSCGTLAALTRTAVGEFRLEQALELECITEQDGVSMDQALAFMPEVIIDPDGYQRIKHGNAIMVAEKGERDIYHRIKYDGQLVALGQFKDDHQVHPEIVL
ncbi:MAG: tRNA pseudouridine(55) synthase TruB [Candidatus Edwardsbacteria bacterium]|nr:tRNA pseudouridine(55) synthase TruB [Candidatus Edwardsbacteria bacterium]